MPPETGEAVAYDEPNASRPRLMRQSVVPSLLSCGLMILVVRMALQSLGFARTIAWIRRRVERIPAGSSADPSVVKAAEGAVALAGAFYPGRARCLEQSLTLYYLLRRRGIAVRYCQQVAAIGSELGRAVAALARIREVLALPPEEARDQGKPPVPAAGGAVVERGVRLSGGQRQQVAIARGYWPIRGFRMLDEAAAHLGSESEALIQDALGTLCSGQTTFVIAHSAEDYSTCPSTPRAPERSSCRAEDARGVGGKSGHRSALVGYRRICRTCRASGDKKNQGIASEVNYVVS